MKLLPWISILILSFTGCSPSFLKGFHKEQKKTVDLGSVPGLITIGDEIQKYNLSFDYGKRHFSGMLLIKKNEDHYRILYNSHFGLSIFDFELNQTGLTVHQCIEPLQKKRLLRLLQHDLSLLPGLNFTDKNPAIVYLPDTDNELVALKFTKGTAKGYYIYDKKTRTANQIKKGRGFGKTIVSRTNENQLKINHPRLGLVLTLEPINPTSDK